MELKVTLLTGERFHNSRALSNGLQRGFLPAKKPLGSCGLL
jgi:hypothetical protein